MNYTNFILISLGLFGMVIHNFIKMDSINRKFDGNFNIWKYLSIEKFSILLSVCVIIVATIVKAEIKDLDTIATKYLGITFITIGYTAQSIIVKFMGKADKIVDNRTGYTAPNDEEQQNNKP